MRSVYLNFARRRPEPASLVIGRAPQRTKQSRESVENEKLKREAESYTLHKHFYGNGWPKFF